MSDPRAIDGDYADFKLIKTRQVCQIIVEVPLERAEQVTRLLGFPKPGTGTRCAVALLNDGASSAGGKDLTHSGSGQPQERLNEVPPAKPNSTRAVMMAKDDLFRNFLADYYHTRAASEAEADAAIKMLCEVKSKSELNDAPGALAFEEMRAAFGRWRREFK